MKKRLPKLSSNKAAEHFVASADLTQIRPVANGACPTSLAGSVGYAAP